MKSVVVDTERLKECREKNGISKNKAAKLIHVAQPTYLRYESGAIYPSEQVLREIALVFNTSVEYLTGKSNDPASVTYLVEKGTEPIIFDIVEECRKKNSSQLERILEYARKLKG